MNLITVLFVLGIRITSPQLYFRDTAFFNWRLITLVQLAGALLSSSSSFSDR